VKILTINTGSSSVRLASFDRNGDALTELASVRHESGREPAVILREFVEAHGLTKPDVAVHRVVHGGTKLTASRLLDQEVEREIERLVPLAPLHNPVALRWIRASREMLGKEVSQIAVFDTAFFTTLPEVARAYALPHELTEKYGLRRYGFHGLAHQAMWQAWHAASRGGQPKGREGKVISIQLGSGCSMTATDNGLACDTSMGFSPLEGLVMATRSGDIDAGLLTFLQGEEHLAPKQLDELLNKRSGLLGVSGLSADIRELLDSTDERARLAIDLFCYRVRKYLGAYLAVLGGAQAIIFGGGVGENAPSVREKVLAGMEWCGIRIDSEKNRGASGTAQISSETSKIEVWVIPVNEAAILASEAVIVLAA
jgi:acetate kinase